MSEPTTHAPDPIVDEHRNGLGCARLLVLLAWEAGEVSEGAAADLLGVDRVTARTWKQQSVAHGQRLASREGRDGYVDTCCALLRREMSARRGHD